MADICSVCGPHRPLEYFSHPVPQHQLPISYLHMFRFPRLWGGYSLQLPPTQINSSEGHASSGKCQGNRKGLFPLWGSIPEVSQREKAARQRAPSPTFLFLPHPSPGQWSPVAKNNPPSLPGELNTHGSWMNEKFP